MFFCLFPVRNRLLPFAAKKRPMVGKGLIFFGWHAILLSEKSETGKDCMKIEVKIDPSCHEPEVLILTSTMSDEVRRITEKLAEISPEVFSGIRGGKVEILDPDELIRVYAGGGKVFAVTGQGEYLLRFRLYEVEARLDPARFVRISNSEIVNLKKIRHFDLSFTGTIGVTFSDGSSTYVSRRYVPKIKKLLGM